MSRTLASTVLSVLNSTAVLITALSAGDAKVYVSKASTTEVLATVYMFEADEFWGQSFGVIDQKSGAHYFPNNEQELKAAIERVSGYPTEADMRRNWSNPVYVVTDY